MDRYHLTARSLLIDHATAEIVDALGRAGVEVVVLKGPGVRDLLYQDHALRPYGDTDLLVRAEDEDAAAATLRGLGFAPAPGTGRPDPGVAREHIWLRDGMVAELHVTLKGVTASPSRVWEVFAAGAEHLDIGGVSAAVPSVEARAMHLALHACQHGVAASRPVADLARGVRQLPLDTWRAAAGHASALGATSAFRAGLVLVPGGAELADAVVPEAQVDVDSVLAATSAPAVALGLRRLVARGGLRDGLRHALRSAFPSPSFLRWWTPLARRGPLGLAAAYVWRPFWLVTKLPGALIALRRARRVASGRRSLTDTQRRE